MLPLISINFLGEMLLSLPLFLIIISTSVTAIDWSDINLHQSHVPLYLQSHADLKIECSVDPECPFKVGDCVYC